MYTKISDLKAGAAKGHDAPKVHPQAIAPEKNYIPLFVPMGSPKPPHGYKEGDTPETNPSLMYCQDEIVPVHTTCMRTRGNIMHELMDSKMRSGNIGTIYNAYFYTIVCVILTIVLAGINIYAAAVTAYFAGYFWSERLLNSAWSISWFKNKTVTYTP